MKRALTFFRLTRPLFLFGAVNLYAIGVFFALMDGYSASILPLITGQAMVTAIQLMTQYSNEYYDQATDAVNVRRTWFSGGSGVLAEGAVPPQTPLRAALVCAAVAGLLILYNFTWSIPLGLLGVVSLILSWLYSGPPLRLVARGIGEAAASVVVAGLVPIVGYLAVSGGPLGRNVLVTTLPLMLLHYAMLIAFAIPDRDADAATGKGTVVVRFGMARTAIFHNLLLLAAFCVILVLIWRDSPGTQWLWAPLPLAIWQFASILRYATTSPRYYHGLTLRAVFLFAITCILWLAGIAIPVLGSLVPQILAQQR